MECAKDLDVSEALLEVEKDLSLPSNSLVAGTPSPKISTEEDEDVFRPKLHGESAGETYQAL